jgi:hypothetical protein
VRAALALAVGSLLVAGCSSLHDIHVFQVSILDDTPSPVIVRDCDTYCSSSPIALRVQPGGSVPINRDAGEHKVFSITTAGGAHVGCLDLYYPSPQPGATARVSDATPCAAGTRPVWETLLFALVLIGAVGGGIVAVLRRKRL